MRAQQYYIKPPDVPNFFYKFSLRAWTDLMVWSWNEYQERLKQTARRGYVREYTYQEREYSPERILAEMSGYRHKCSIMSPGVWRKFTRSQQDYLMRCFNLRDLILRESPL